MLDLFSRRRGHNYFKTRSAARDTATDQSRVTQIADLIDQAIASAEAEYTGLSNRLQEVGACAAMTAGNAVDEYLTRESKDNRALQRLETEMANAERRQKELTTSIGHFKFLKAALSSRFTDLKPPSDDSRI